MLFFPTESKCDLNGLCRILDPEKKRKPCSQEPISNVTSAAGVITVNHAYDRSLINKTSLFLVPCVEDEDDRCVSEAENGFGGAKYGAAPC